MWKPKSAFARFVFGSLAIWAGLLTLLGTYYFVADKLGIIQPEIGPFGAFVFFGATLSLPYFILVAFGAGFLLLRDGLPRK
jgi:hypothetical protein